MKPYAAFAIAALLAGTAAPAAAQRSDTFDWSGPLVAGRTITVQGLNGSIEASPASGGTVQVTARKRSRDDDLDQVRIEVRETADGLTICPIYPGRSACPGENDDENRGRRRDRNDVRVDFDIRVPTGVHLDAATVNGEIEVRALTGDVRASSVNGAISVASTGAVEARTVNGSIEAASARDRWNGTLDFRTVNGSIELTLPAGVAARVQASTVHGGLTSDFPLTIEAGRQWGPRSMEGAIGQGGGTLRMETVNGAIHLRRG